MLSTFVIWNMSLLQNTDQIVKFYQVNTDNIYMVSGTQWYPVTEWQGVEHFAPQRYSVSDFSFKFFNLIAK